MTIPNSALVPLRRTSVWEGFGRVQAIPHIYGETRAPLLQYSQDRTVWVWCDHAVLSIDSVQIDGLPIEGWEWENGTDNTGHAVAFVRTSEPVPDGSSASASGRGKLSPASGALIDTPAGVVEDLLNNVAGRSFDLGRFDVVSDHIEVGGAIDDAGRTIRSYIDEVMRSAGAVWSGAMDGFARIYPADPDANEPDWHTFTERNSAIDATVAEADIVNAIVVAYGYDYADQRHRGAVAVEVPESIRAFGRREQEIDARWLRAKRGALAFATAQAEHLARPVWRINIEADATAYDVPAGAFPEINHADSPVSGRVFLSNARRNLDDRSTVFEALAPAGDAPAVEVVNLTDAFTVNEYAGATLQTAGDERILTITDETGRPMPNARVTLNGDIVKTTDAAGRVKFSAREMPLGSHTLRIVGTNGVAFELTVTV